MVKAALPYTAEKVSLLLTEGLIDLLTYLVNICL